MTVFLVACKPLVVICLFVSVLGTINSIYHFKKKMLDYNILSYGEYIRTRI